MSRYTSHVTKDPMYENTHMAMMRPQPAKCCDQHVYVEPSEVVYKGYNTTCSSVVSGISILLALVVIALTVIDLTRENICTEKTNTKTGGTGSFTEVCVESSKLGLTGHNVGSSFDSLRDTLLTKSEDGIEKRCARDSFQLSALSMLLQEEKQKKLCKVTTETRFITASAHKRLLQPLSELFQPKRHQIVRLDPSSNDQVGEHARGVTVNQDGLSIQFSGLYFVYSSVNYISNITKQPHQHADNAFIQYIHRVSMNDPNNTGEILQSAHSTNHITVQDAHTTFTGGVFHLEAGDLIQVCISSTSYSDFKKESTYVGLIMLGSNS